MFRSVIKPVALALSLAALSAPLAAQGSMQAMGNQPGKPPLSPRDSISTTVAGSAIKVNYGRPSKRGRVIFGGLEKWGNVWRTGANEATHFTTSKALDFGGKVVPAGTYTLWTKLEESGKWELIVNKQTGQWGTAYKASEDLVSIPMKVTSTNPVVEQMEIQVKPAGKGGEIIVQWDTYKAVATFTVK
ncbi:MAG: DUF2911 domain-containing protein [Gemmatimonadetes bacterium]|nr:DUF2911 domain-containing protein [Gemmatimonadota bacterium]